LPGCSATQILQRVRQERKIDGFLFGCKDDLNSRYLTIELEMSIAQQTIAVMGLGWTRRTEVLGPAERQDLNQNKADRKSENKPE
jgi:hypothetical protein